MAKIKQMQNVPFIQDWIEEAEKKGLQEGRQEGKSDQESKSTC